MSGIEEVLCAGAPEAGLRTSLQPFDQGGDLATRFAKNPFLMAPMAGVSDAAYRIMARAGGAALAYSEMVSVAGLHYGGEKTWALAEPHPYEPDLAVQLFGADPEQFAEAASLVSERVGNKLRVLDINMACPVPKVTKGGGGAALLDDKARAMAIVRACVAHTQAPVTVKIRRGRTVGNEVAPEFARALADAGAAAVAVHGRFATQLYHGEADWGTVARVAQAVDVPVIGSGDVSSAQEAARMLVQCGCAAVMVARGTYGNPWVFGDANRALAGESLQAPSILQRLAAFSLHVRLLEQTHAHLARARSLAGWYFRGMSHAAYWRGQAVSCVTSSDFLSLVDRLRSEVVCA